MEGVAVVEMNAEKKLEMVLQKYLKDIPMNDKQMILEMILKVAVISLRNLFQKKLIMM